MTRPRLLDAYCGAGGAAVGYDRAGFEVVGIDIRPQPRYPFEFHQGDAIDYIREHGHEFDCIHASPPCQHYANVTRWRGTPSNHPDLIGPTREALTEAGIPWVIENVPSAPIRPDVVLCGSHFGLKVRRHRWFEFSWRAFFLVPTCAHAGLLPFEHKAERAYADAMSCEWMTKFEARQAIPPAYTELIGRQLMTAVLAAKEAA